jgi:hypothetical protein
LLLGLGDFSCLLTLRACACAVNRKFHPASRTADFAMREVPMKWAQIAQSLKLFDSVASALHLAALYRHKPVTDANAR